ncbi:MAG: GYF domain-containing protein [Haloferula sp.]
MSEWFISRNGEQEGPLTAQKVGEMLASGELKASEALAWKEGMSDWTKLAESGVLAEASMSAMTRPDGLAVPSAVQRETVAPATVSQPQVQPAGTVNPYSSPETTISYDQGYEAALEYPGIGRLAYFLLQLVLSVVAYALLFMFILGTAGSSDFASLYAIFIGVMLVAGAGGLWIGIKRVQNLGMSGWAVLWSLVPIMSIWIGWRMFACPSGYHDHKQLDTAGKVLTGIMIGLIVLSIVLNIAAVFIQPDSY